MRLFKNWRSFLFENQGPYNHPRFDKLTQSFLEHPDDRLNLEDMQCIINYADKNPESTLHEIALHFSHIFGHKIDHTIVHQIIRENVPNKNTHKYRTAEEIQLIRESFSQDLYDEMSRRQSLTDENLTTNENLRALALELAINPKYDGYLSSYKFQIGWLSKFRKKYNLEVSGRRWFSLEQKQEILKYIESNPGLGVREVGAHFSTIFEQTISATTINKIRQNREKILNTLSAHEKKSIEEKATFASCDLAKRSFSQTLYEEANRRQSQTEEDLSSNKHLRALALELARQPKYEKYMGNFKFSNTWLSEFRKKFKMVATRSIVYPNPI